MPPRVDASHLNNPAPVYPAPSRRLREEGRVLLDVYILPDGSVGQIRLRASSGFRRLDQSGARCGAALALRARAPRRQAITYWAACGRCGCAAPRAAPRVSGTPRVSKKVWTCSDRIVAAPILSGIWSRKASKPATTISPAGRNCMTNCVWPSGSRPACAPPSTRAPSGCRAAWPSSPRSEGGELTWPLATDRTNTTRR
ncbi:MAG: energy transducer TonB [Candidatus Competibacteraceae bacterium]